jgi:hypothetical protein
MTAIVCRICGGRPITVFREHAGSALCWKARCENAERADHHVGKAGGYGWKYNVNEAAVIRTWEVAQVQRKSSRVLDIKDGPRCCCGLRLPCFSCLDVPAEGRFGGARLGESATVLR